MTRVRSGPIALVASALALALALVPATARPARADGAFPDSFSPLLPRTRPREILLATNFGLLASGDGGVTWSYACELPESAGGRLYNLGAPPSERIHAVATPGLVTSDDAGCAWTVGGGALARAVALDGFPDPGDDAHVLAIAAAQGSHDAAVFESRDAGRTFSGRLFAPPAGAVLTGVEIAAADTATIYVSFYETPAIHARLARSIDGGAHWATTDLEPALGSAVPFLAAVDTDDPATVYLRVSGRRANEDAYEALAITRDAGATWSTPLVLPGGTLTTFFRRANGDVLATGTLAGARVAYRSDDAGATFAPWPLAIHPRGFGERASLLYAATDNVADGFALASSSDGDHWAPVMRYQDVTAVRACIRPACATDCRYRAGLGLFSDAICDAPPTPDAGDASLPTLPAVRAASGGAGCACGVGMSTPDAHAPVGSMLLAAAAFLLARRRRCR